MATLCFAFTYFSPLHSITNKEKYKKHLCNQSSHYRKYRQLANTATGKPHHAITNQHLVLSVKRTGMQRRTKASPRYMYWMYCSWRKGTPRDEVMPNSEEIMPVALSIVELCLAGGISQLVSQSA